MKHGFLYINEMGSFGVAEEKKVSLLAEGPQRSVGIDIADVHSHRKIKYNSEKESKACFHPTVGAVRAGAWVGSASCLCRGTLGELKFLLD